MAEQCGVEHIQVHGRTREQGYKGLANWDLIKAGKRGREHSRFGQRRYHDHRIRHENAGGDGHGRHFDRARGDAESMDISAVCMTLLPGASLISPTCRRRKDVLLEFFSMCREEMPEIVSLGKMKQLAGQFTKGLVGGAQFRQTLYHSHSADEILDNITTYFETLSTGNVW